MTFAINDRVRYVTTDARRFQTIHTGRITYITDDVLGSPMAVVKVEHTRVEHPLAPEQGRDIPAGGPVAAYFSELVRVDEERRVVSARRVGSYAVAVEWLALNDDNDWLDDENGSPSVSLCLVADVFGRSVEEATADLRRALAKAEARS